MSIREDIAVRLIEERVRLGYSQSDFARQLEVSVETVRRYENGLREAGVEFLAKTAGLGVDVQYVLTGVKSSNLHKAEQASQPLVHIENGNQSGIVNAISGGVVNIGNQVTKVKAEVKPNDEHISQKQASILKQLVNDIVEMEQKIKKNPKSYRAVWGALNAHCGVTRYLLIPYEDFPKAEKYLRMWIGRLNSAKSAPKKDNNQWRNRRYAYIKINTKEVPEWLDNYLHKNFGVDSLTELDDAQLDKVYRAVSSKKSRNKPKPKPNRNGQSGFTDVQFALMGTLLALFAMVLIPIGERLAVIDITASLMFALVALCAYCGALVCILLCHTTPNKAKCRRQARLEREGIKI